MPAAAASDCLSPSVYSPWDGNQVNEIAPFRGRGHPWRSQCPSGYSLRGTPGSAVHPGVGRGDPAYKFLERNKVLIWQVQLPDNKDTEEDEEYREDPLDGVSREAWERDHTTKPISQANKYIVKR